MSLSKDQERHLIKEAAACFGINAPQGAISSYREGDKAFVIITMSEYKQAAVPHPMSTLVAYGNEAPKGYRLPEGYHLEFVKSPSIVDPAGAHSGVLYEVPNEFGLGASQASVTTKTASIGHK